MVSTTRVVVINVNNYFMSSKTCNLSFEVNESRLNFYRSLGYYPMGNMLELQVNHLSDENLLQYLFSNANKVVLTNAHHYELISPDENIMKLVRSYLVETFELFLLSKNADIWNLYLTDDINVNTKFNCLSNLVNVRLIALVS